MKTISYPLRIDKNIMGMVELKARDEYINKSTALRKLLYLGVEEYLINLYKEGRLSIGKISEILGKTIYDVHQLLLRHNIRIKHDEDILAESRKSADEIL